MKKAIMAFAFYSGMTSGMVETSMDDVCKRSLSPISMKNFKNKKMKLSEIEFIKDMGNFRHFDPPFMREDQFFSAQFYDPFLVVNNEEQYSQQQFEELFEKYIDLDQVDLSRKKMQQKVQQQTLVWNLKQQSVLEGENFTKACQFGTYFPNLRKLTINANDLSKIEGDKVFIPRLAELKVIGKISDLRELKLLLSMLGESLKKLEIDVSNLLHFWGNRLNLQQLKELKITDSITPDDQSEEENACTPESTKFAFKKIALFLLNSGLSLKVLDLSNIKLNARSKKLQYAIGESLGLTYLDLSKNRFVTIPRSLKKLKNLIHLNLSNNEIRIGIPEWMTGLSNLTYLDLSKNDISTIPRTIEAFQKLTYLNLSFNCILVLPDYIWNLRKLSYLNLSGNNLSEIPPTINKAKNLTYLNVSNNHITMLPEAIGNLENLTHLDLFGNKNIKFLPNSVIYLFNLKYLDIRRTGIVTLPKIQWWLANFRRMYCYPGSYLYLINLPQQQGNTRKARKQRRS